MAESFKIAEIANAETVATPEPAPEGESHVHQISEPVSSELSRELDAQDHNRATLLSPGKVIDNRYKIEQRIGSGGMGAVYRAEHIMMGRTVAIKVLHPHLVENEELLNRFRQEARVASKIDHINAIETYDFGVWNGAPYLVMEYAEGVTLKQRIEREGRLAIPEIITIFRQVCAGLSRAHELRVVHRDLKPDNIMLSYDSGSSGGVIGAGDKNRKLCVRVLDFGIAKLLKEGSDKQQPNMTQAGTFFGTPKYASPEQVLEKPVDARSDIYTLGVILYEAISGQVPFDAPSVMEILIKHINEEPVPLRRFTPELKLPPKLDELVMRCLEKDPEDRFQSVTELEAALSEIKTSAPAWKSAAAIAVAACACIGVFFAIYRLRQQDILPAEVRPPNLVAKDINTIDTRQTVAPTENEPKTSDSAKALPNIKDNTTVASPLFSFALSQVIKNLSGSEKQNAEVLSESEPEILPLPAPPEPVADTSLLLSETLPTLATGDSGSQLSGDKLGELAKIGGEEVKSYQPQPEPVPEVAQPPKLSGGKKEAQRIYAEGRKLLQDKRYAEAAAKFEQVVRLREDAVGSFISLGNCYLRLERYDEAKSAFESALRIDSQYGPAHYNLAAFLALRGDDSGAISHLSKAVALDARARIMAKDDSDFARLRNSAEFKELIKR